MGTNSAPLLADLFLHTFEYDFMLRTMKETCQKLSNLAPPFVTSTIYSASITTTLEPLSVRFYPSELELKDTTLSSTEVCYLDTKIVHGDSSAAFHISVYDKR